MEKDVVGSQCKAIHKDVAYLESSQEEAKLLLRAIDATTLGGTYDYDYDYYYPDMSRIEH